MEIASLNETAVNSNMHGVAMDSATMHSVAVDSTNRTYMPYYLHSTGMAISYILCYVVVLLLCVGGNVLVSLVVLRNRNMRSVTNLFILNLAISDLLIGVFCVPTTLIDSLISGEKVEGAEMRRAHAEIDAGSPPQGESYGSGGESVNFL